eukprot:Skav227814  [mRNA]  locus=scaffold948:187932:188984:+ [translate_table: standard]
MLTWSAPRIVKSVNQQVASYNMAMSQLVSDSHWPRVLAMLQNMPQQSLQPDRVSYNVAISACGKGIRWQGALQLAVTGADLIGFSAAMVSCVRARQLDQSLSLLNLTQMQRLGVDVVLLGSVLSACERLNRWRTALHLFDLGRPQQSLQCCHHVLSTCSKASRWFVGLQLLQQMAGHLLPDALTFAGTMEAISFGSRWRAAVHLLEQIRVEPSGHLPSGHLQVIQQDILCKAQVWWSMNVGLKSLVRWDAKAVTGDPDEGKVHRMAEVASLLQEAGCMSVAVEKKFHREVFQPAVPEALKLMEPPTSDLASTVQGANLLSLATTGLGGLEREALVVLLQGLRRPVQDSIR